MASPGLRLAAFSRVCVEADFLDQVLLRQFEDHDDAGGGGFEAGLDVGEFSQAVNPLIVTFDGGGFKFVAFVGADLRQDLGLFGRGKRAGAGDEFYLLDGAADHLGRNGREGARGGESGLLGGDGFNGRK